MEAAKALAQQAVAMARLLGDPAVLATSLAGLADFPSGPEESEEMLAGSIEMIETARRAGDVEVESRGNFRSAVFALELGDIRRADQAVEEMRRINAELDSRF